MTAETKATGPDYGSLAVSGKDAAMVRDGGRCRIPTDFGPHEGAIEGHHISVGPMDVDRLLRSETWDLMAICSGHYATGALSIHGREIKIIAETPGGADGTCSFWRRGDDGAYFMVRREVALFTYERD